MGRKCLLPIQNLNIMLRIKNVSKRRVVNPEARNFGQVVYVIETDNKVVPTIIRTEEQFKADLERNFLTVNDCRDLVGGEVNGEFTPHKEGETFVDPRTGEERVFKQDGLWVEGFLQLRINEKADMMNRIAKQTGTSLLSLFGSVVKSAAPVAEIDNQEDYTETVKTPNPAVVDSL